MFLNFWSKWIIWQTSRSRIETRQCNRAQKCAKGTLAENTEQDGPVSIFYLDLRKQEKTMEGIAFNENLVFGRKDIYFHFFSPCPNL